MAQPRCPYCSRWFTPAPRKGARQTTCGRRACRRRHKRELGRRWRAKNPEPTLGRHGKVRAWAAGCDYWKVYLKTHPEAAERNRVQTRERMRRLREERRRARAVLSDPAGYLRGVRARCEGVCKTGTGGALVPTGGEPTDDDVCKTGTGQGSVVEVVDYLLARELFANQEGRDVRGAPRP